MDEKRMALLDQLSMAAEAHAKRVLELAGRAVIGSADFAILKKRVDEAWHEMENARSDLHNYLRKHLKWGATAASVLLLK